MINNINSQWVVGEEVYISTVFLCFFAQQHKVLFYHIFSGSFCCYNFPFCLPTVQSDSNDSAMISTLSWLISLLTNLVPIPQWLDCYGSYKNTNSCVLVLDCSSMFLKLWSYLVGVLRSFIAVGFFVLST